MHVVSELRREAQPFANCWRVSVPWGSWRGATPFSASPRTMLPRPDAFRERQVLKLAVRYVSVHEPHCPVRPLAVRQS